jgi:hypothetical protein
MQQMLAVRERSHRINGRLLLSIWAIGTIPGGLVITLTGMFPIFVPQDL